MYDMYMVDFGADVGDDEVAIYPVPVRNMNFGDGDDTPNVNAHPEDEEDDKLTRRFFLCVHRRVCRM